MTTERTYSVVVTYRDRLATSVINLSMAQTIEALVQINREFDRHGVSASDRMRVLVLEESQTRH